MSRRLRPLHARVAALAALLAMPCGRVAAGTAVPTFLLAVTRLPDSSMVHGNGFVVRDWRTSDPDALLLVTAAHVLHRAISIQVLDVDCHAATAGGVEALLWLIEEQAPVLVWPRHDLAAVPFRESAARPELRAALARKGGPGRASFDGTIPATHEKVSVDATSSISPCQAGFATVVEHPNAVALLRAITGKAEPGPDELGSMLPSTPLLQYQGTTAKGASGAAVTRDAAPGVVVAVHVAGLDTGQVSWGVLLPGARASLDATVLESRLGEPAWTGYRLPKLPQSSAIPDGVRERSRPWVPGVSAPSLALFVESGIWRSPYRPVAFGALASHALLRFASETDLRWAWGVRLQLGYVGAHVPARTLGPDGSTLFERTRLVHGVVVGASPELELRPTASLRPSVGLGARLRTTRLDVDGWSWGFPVYGRVALSVSQRWSLGLEGWVALEKGVSRGGRLTGFGAVAAPLPRRWGAVAGAAGSCSW